MRRAAFPVIVLCLIGALIYLAHENRQKQAVIKRVRAFDFFERMFTNTTEWTEVDGKKRIVRIDQKQTQIKLEHTGNGVSDTCTIVKIYNPAYTPELAQVDYDFNFSRTKWLAAMKKQGFKAIIFSNGKKLWNFPAKIEGNNP